MKTQDFLHHLARGIDSYTARAGLTIIAGRHGWWVNNTYNANETYVYEVGNSAGKFVYVQIRDAMYHAWERGGAAVSLNDEAQLEAWLTTNLG